MKYTAGRVSLTCEIQIQTIVTLSSMSPTESYISGESLVEFVGYFYLLLKKKPRTGYFRLIDPRRFN